MTSRPGSGRPTLSPTEVRDILEGVARDRPELLRDSAMPAARTHAPSTQVTVEWDALAQDLLHGIPHADRPALVEHARLVARSALWLRDFDNVMTAAIANGQGDYLAIVDRLQRMKERESAIYSRGLLILEMMRQHHVQVRTAHPHRQRRRGRRVR